MGESTAFRCETCGYESRGIKWGVSMVDPRRRYMPAHCMQCKDYVEVDLTGADMLIDEFRCTACGSEVFFVDKADTYGCPKCGNGNVNLVQGSTYW